MLSPPRRWRRLATRELPTVRRPDAGVVTASERVSVAERTQVEAVEAAAASADGVSALDDQAHLDLQFDGASAVRHLLVREPGEDVVVGYAQLRLGLAADDTAVGQVVVDPRHRGHGLGAALLRGCIEEAGTRPLRVWAHGDHPAARRLAAQLNFVAVRELRQLRATLDKPLVVPPPASEVTLRTFVVGRDEDAWLAVNAAAFRDHPEQGRLTAVGLGQRMAQPWFDPAGFFLAERNGRLLGYHWTKVHPADTVGRDPLGEVYVLGVHPDAQGLGLGKTLTLIGLEHLQSRGLGEVMLYVESDNTAALALYQRLGFRHVSSDVMYERRGSAADGSLH